MRLRGGPPFRQHPKATKLSRRSTLRILLVCSIIATLRGVPRVEIFVFFDHWKKPLFIVREAAQAAACNAFVHDLIDQIEALDHNSAKARSLRQVADATGTAAGPARDPDRGDFGARNRSG